MLFSDRLPVGIKGWGVHTLVSNFYKHNLKLWDKICAFRSNVDMYFKFF